MHHVVTSPDVHGALALLLLPDHQDVVVLRQLGLADLKGCGREVRTDSVRPDGILPPLILPRFHPPIPLLITPSHSDLLLHLVVGEVGVAVDPSLADGGADLGVERDMCGRGL